MWPLTRKGRGVRVAEATCRVEVEICHESCQFWVLICRFQVLSCFLLDLFGRCARIVVWIVPSLFTVKLDIILGVITLVTAVISILPIIIRREILRVFLGLIPRANILALIPSRYPPSFTPGLMLPHQLVDHPLGPLSIQAQRQTQHPRLSGPLQHVGELVVLPDKSAGTDLRTEAR